MDPSLFPMGMALIVVAVVTGTWLATRRAQR
jgi:hypothetical protein